VLRCHKYVNDPALTESLRDLADALRRPTAYEVCLIGREHCELVAAQLGADAAARSPAVGKNIFWAARRLGNGSPSS
jgi:hypothetical protein